MIRYKRMLQVWVLACLVLLMLSACEAKKYEAQAINEAVDKCSICNMSVKDDPYATQLITLDGQSLKFDDIGCMNKWKKQNGTETVGAEFVRDHNSGNWIRYEDAFYAYDPMFKTPMAYGVVAFKSEASAKQFIEKQGKGKLLSAADLASHTWEVNREMMNMGGMEHHDESKHSGEGSKEMKPGHGAEGKTS
ncbi:nitrous oxide reductase accessory protein NosL [Paenibacillus turpanensis]|uniref:nitrous oxide reductase accessory protein NosL n=1 Tax=Paenibacillus turpanensis TaxID=2689078 RepID=UPI001FB7B776|nr:nitrous oxide reductase accessory protein NosL [Paenibacillus turpanensis]